MGQPAEWNGRTATDMNTPCARPRSLLVATDLSSRCDRAIDRGVLLAREWGARLVVVTVLEKAQMGELQAQGPLAFTADEAAQLQDQARRRLQAELGDAAVPFDLVVAHGAVGPALLKVVAERGCDLIVTGSARAHGLGRLVLGSTVDLLVRRSPVPVLVVRQRGRRPYPRLVVASDWSASSRRALEMTAAGWPEVPITLFHAYGAAYPARAGMDLAMARDAGGEQATRTAAAFVADARLPDEVRRRLQLWLASGDPGLLLQAHGWRHPYELVVLGTAGRSGLAAMLLGSVAARLLDMVENDVLVVRKL